MKYVLDSNVALKWVLRENNSDKARQLRIDYQQKIGLVQLRVALRAYYPEA